MGRGMGRGGGGAGWPSSGPGDKVEYVMVASNKVGLVIGKGGETIKSINQASGAHVEIDRNAPPEATEKNFIIKGSAEAVDRAKSMVLEKIGAIEGSGYGAFPGQTFIPNGGRGGGRGGHNYGGGDYYGGAGGGAPQQGGPAINPTTGQPDYSAQWAEYYRSIGKVKEAEQIEAQIRAKGSGGGPSPGQPQPQTYVSQGYYQPQQGGGYPPA